MAMSRSLGDRVLTTRSPIFMVPEEMSSSPATIRRAVLLPQPDGPTRTRNSPCLMSRSRSWTAWNPFSYCLLTLSRTTSAMVPSSGIGWSGELPELERRPVAGQGHRAVGIGSQGIGVAVQVWCLAGQAEWAGGKAQRPVPGPGGQDQQPLALALAQERERVALGVNPAQSAPAQRVVGAAQPGERAVVPEGGPVPGLEAVPGERLAGAGVADPSMPISSPAKTIGAPGMVNSSPAATSPTAGVGDHAADPGGVVRPQQRPRGHRGAPGSAGQEGPHGG